MIKNEKEAVKLRGKRLSDGSESLYLDIYLNGKRKYEYLKLYLLPGKENKVRNKETMALANAVKARRVVEIQSGRFGFEKKPGEGLLLLDFLEEYVEEKRKKKTERYAYGLMTMVKHVKRHIGKKKVLLSDVDKDWCLKFIAYLEKFETNRGVPLARNSIHHYYGIFSVAMNKAVEKDLIVKNPCNNISAEDKPSKVRTKREYLTMDELRILVDSDAKDMRIKRAFMFSCFTGLRFSDISKLQWKDVREIDSDVIQLEFEQQKTRQHVVVPLNSNALMWLPERDSDNKLVFNLQEYSVVEKKLIQWIEKTGIGKKVTFHVARHTYATLLLYYGADLYTVSKLLGHANIQTTQIYAKVMDESKRKAVNLIPEI